MTAIYIFSSEKDMLIISNNQSVSWELGAILCVCIKGKLHDDIYIYSSLTQNHESNLNFSYFMMSSKYINKGKTIISRWSFTITVCLLIFYFANRWQLFLNEGKMFSTISLLNSGKESSAKGFRRLRSGAGGLSTSRLQFKFGTFYSLFPLTD